MKNRKPNIEHLYPIKAAKDMKDDEFSRWWALMESLEIIFNHADKYSIDIDSLNLNTKKILDEYVTPMSGDILHDIQVARSSSDDPVARNIIKI